MSFLPLGLSDELLSAVADSGYTEPTDIQRGAIPLILMGRDVVGVAQTGTGKTASFVLPMIDILAQGRSRAMMPRSLIIAPTRELAMQVAENFEKYGKNHKLNMALLIGGVGFAEQNKLLEKGVDVLIATPGRLLDQFERGKILLSGVDILVIDEADRMLDMGFIPDVEKICGLLGRKRQTLLFSATMAPPIKKLADQFMESPKRIEVARQSSTNENIEQHLVEVAPRSKRTQLKKLLATPDLKSAIVFCNRKKDIKDLVTSLKQDGFRAGQIHGDMEQRDRMAMMEAFKSDEVNVLVASDVAARGLDIKGVSHIFNFDVPFNAEDYVHRIGRTGRAGAKGKSYTFATKSDAELVADIEKLTKQRIPRLGETGNDPQGQADSAAQDTSPADDKPKRTRRPRSEKTNAPEPLEASAKQSAPKARAEPKPEPKSRAKSHARPGPKSESGSDRTAARRTRDDAPYDEAPLAEDAKAEWNGPVPDFLSR
ncbi:DEAD/DEAH box helicase [Pacificimonas sp. WHA3]|uniref:DEAD/DEAH box helicase n=1 Tax=Pacificimonas pallii TaxID=2827236 RepID=A0ABS6SCW9_9SPHN|nr:DEAD/DEAH box helicase [Pacificimonas pallii]MBV7256080.1 DEAD/DEAH box helicase [Pacificimonas pallii]